MAEVKWLNDNRTLLFNQTREGYLNWYTIGAAGGSVVREITADNRNNRALSLDPDKDRAVYLSGRDEIRIMDLKTWQSKTIVKDEIWALWADMTDPRFSPDGRFICYTAHRDSEEDTFVYDIESGKSTNLTKTGVTETGPMWGPDGKYLYFSASRTVPAFPLGMQNARIYRLPLENLNAPAESKRVSIDSAGIMERIEQKGASFGSNYLIDRVQSGGQTMLFSISDQDRGNWTVYRTVVRDFEQDKTEKVAGAPEGRGVNFRMTGNDSLFFALVNGNIYRFWPLENKMEPVTIDYEFSKSQTGEFIQVFYNAWAKVEENYYDKSFQGVDWGAIKDRYAPYLPFVQTRQDLRTLINDMLGELNSSHQRFNSYGEEERAEKHVRTMETGIVFANTAPYQVQRVLHGSAADKKDLALLPGDELVQVDSVLVDPARNRDFYFTKPVFQSKLDLTFRRGQRTFQVTIHPQGGISSNLYDEWIAANRARVVARGNGRIAYAYLKDMETGSYDNFLIEMSGDLHGKEGLILDLRYNDGGIRHDDLLRFLSQKSYAQWAYRGGKITSQSHFTPSDKPIVLLINEKTLSDAELTAAGFRALGLGKVIGNETYHWEIFTRPFYMVDGSSVRLPAWGCYSLDGQDIELTGVKPDIPVVNTFEDHISGRPPPA